MRETVKRSNIIFRRSTQNKWLQRKKMVPADIHLSSSLAVILSYHQAQGGMPFEQKDVGLENVIF